MVSAGCRKGSAITVRDEMRFFTWHLDARLQTNGPREALVNLATNGQGVYDVMHTENKTLQVKAEVPRPVCQDHVTRLPARAKDRAIT